MLLFSIVTVTYNAGKELLRTVESVLGQKCQDFEIIVKDAGSTDHSIDNLPEDDRIRKICISDKGIYDAMNQALPYVNGQYTIFLNAGDYFYNKDVLSNLQKTLRSSRKQYDIYFGDVYIRSRSGFVNYPDKLDLYFLMTRSICHQAMFFSKRIIDICRYDSDMFKYAADMEFYVNAILNKKASYLHINEVIVNYEGGGTSETCAHKKIVLTEKKKIMKRYLNEKEYFFINLKKILTLKTVKEKIGSSKLTKNIYEKMAIKLIRKTEK